MIYEQLHYLYKWRVIVPGNLWDIGSCIKKLWEQHGLAVPRGLDRRGRVWTKTQHRGATGTLTTSYKREWTFSERPSGIVRVKSPKVAQIPKGVPNHLYYFPNSYGAHERSMLTHTHTQNHCKTKQIVHNFHAAESQ